MTTARVASSASAASSAASSQRIMPGTKALSLSGG
jgi:hypothetical protein